jgi:periplasmic divalent cation tolerance protein
MAEIKFRELLIVTTSFAALEDARVMAHKLVEQGLAACIQIQEDVHSIYRWKGSICEEKEVILVAKTNIKKWLEISSFIKAEHPYELPEIIAVTPTEYDWEYGKCVGAAVDLES